MINADKGEILNQSELQMERLGKKQNFKRWWGRAKSKVQNREV